MRRARQTGLCSDSDGVRLLRYPEAGRPRTALSLMGQMPAVNERDTRAMPFIRVPGTPGLFYVPDSDCSRPKKHPCPDCHFCQMCSDERCRLCLGSQARGGGCRGGKQLLSEAGIEGKAPDGSAGVCRCRNSGRSQR